MRAFIQFIKRFFNLLLFIGFEIVCLVLITRSRHMLQGDDILSSANAVSGYVYNRQNAVVSYFGLRKMNDSLLNENLRLQTELIRYQEQDTLAIRSVQRTFTDEDDTTHLVHYARYRYFAARVISNSTSATNNFITLNLGSEDGVAKNMAVVSGNGVVGRVVSVSRHFATVLSILNTKQAISARLKDGTDCSIFWKDGGRPEEVFVKDIPQEIKVKTGDSVFTTSYSSLFPRDILIGIIFKIEVERKNNSKILHVRPATNFRNLQYVYVIRDEMLDERRDLEDSTKLKK